MAVLIRGYSSTSCDTNRNCPFRNCSIRRRNKFHRLRLSLMSSGGVFSKGLTCNVATCFLDSDISTKEELHTPIWILEGEFAIDRSIEGNCSTEIEDRSIEGNCSTEIEDRSIEGNCSTEIEDRSIEGNCSTEIEDRSIEGNCSTEIEDRSIEGSFSTEIEDRSIEENCSTEIDDRSQADSKHNDITLHFLEERDEKILSKRLVALSRSNKKRSALELYLSMEASNIIPDAYACNLLLSCLLRNGSLPDALEVFDKLSKRDMAITHTYTLVLKAIARYKGSDAAITMFNKLERDESSKGKLDAIVYNTMISVCAKAKDWIETEKLWIKLHKNSIKGTSLTYELLISTFVQCKCTDLALKAYHESIRFGFESSEANMKAIIATCTQEGNWESAVVVLGNMLERGIKPNLIAFNSVINCLGKAGKFELAFRVYQTLCSSGLQPDMYTWYALISALYRSSKYLEVIKLFQWVKRKAKVELDSPVYNVALLACRKQGMWAQALQLLWEMESCKIEVPIRSYNHVISTCEKAGEVKVAFQVYQHMVQQGCNGDDFTYMSVIRCSISGSLWDEFLEALKHVPSGSSVYYSTIQELCSQGKIGMAKEILVQMLKLGLRLDARTSSLMLQHFST